jgi:hypothetical protein
MTPKEMVLAELKKNKIKVISNNDFDYEIKVEKKIKVKKRDINNSSTNNSIETDGSYDVLVLILVDGKDNSFFIIPRDKVKSEKKGNVELSTTNKDGILKNIKLYKDRWDYI